MKSPEAPGRDQAQQRFVSSTWSKSSPSPPRRVQVDDAIFQITFEQLQEHFHMPLAQVARKFGVGTTFLKKKCRTHGIKRWPFRKIRSQNSQKQEDMYPEGNFDALKVAMCGPPPPPDVDQNGKQNGNHSNATRGAQMIVDAARSSQREPEAAALAALTTLCQAAEAEQQQPPEVEQEEVLPAPVVRDPTPAQRLIPYTLISPPPSFPPAVKGAETTDARTKRERLESMDIQQFSQNSAKKHSLASGAMKAKHLTGCWRLKVDGDGSEDPGSWVLSDGVNSCTTHEFFGANNV